MLIISLNLPGPQSTSKMERVIPSLQHHCRDSCEKDMKEAGLGGAPLPPHGVAPWTPAEPWKSWDSEVAASLREGSRPSEQSQGWDPATATVRFLQWSWRRSGPTIICPAQYRALLRPLPFLTWEALPGNKHTTTPGQGSGEHPSTTLSLSLGKSPCSSSSHLVLPHLASWPRGQKRLSDGCWLQLDRAHSREGSLTPDLAARQESLLRSGSSLSLPTVTS